VRVAGAFGAFAANRVAGVSPTIVANRLMQIAKQQAAPLKWFEQNSLSLEKTEKLIS